MGHSKEDSLTVRFFSPICVSLFSNLSLQTASHFVCHEQTHLVCVFIAQVYLYGWHAHYIDTGNVVMGKFLWVDVMDITHKTKQVMNYRLSLKKDFRDRLSINIGRIIVQELYWS
jgi:hypothetical protein